MRQKKVCVVGSHHEILFRRGHVTPHPVMSVGRSVHLSIRPPQSRICKFFFRRRHYSTPVGPSVGRSKIFLNLRANFALLLLPIYPWLDCLVSSLVFHYCPCPKGRGVLHSYWKVVLLMQRNTFISHFLCKMKLRFNNESSNFGKRESWAYHF